MAQKLLLFWRKPARRCWWEGIELNDVEGVEGPVKVWIRRVWTLEMVRLPSSVDSKLLIANPIAECYWASLIFFPLLLSLACAIIIPPALCLEVSTVIFFSKVAFKYLCNKYSSFHLTESSAGVLSSLGVLIPFGAFVF